MKNIVRLSALLIIIIIISSCEKDEGLLPDISFKTGANYVSEDAVKPGGSTIVIGIEAAKTEKKDVLTKFNISKSVDGAAATAVYNEDLAGSDGDNYDYDYTTTLSSNSGETNEFIFTVTNRDGLVNQVSLTVTVE